MMNRDFSRGQAGNGVWPRVQPMPAQVDVGAVLFRQALDAELLDQPVKRGAVQVVEPGPGLLALADAVHRGMVGGAPRIHQSRPVGSDSALRAERGQVRDQAGAPVHDGAEGVEDNGDGLFRWHGRFPCCAEQQSLGGRRGQAVAWSMPPAHGPCGPCRRRLLRSLEAIDAAERASYKPPLWTGRPWAHPPACLTGQAAAKLAKRYLPHNDRPKGIGQWVSESSREAHLSTVEAGPQAAAWVSRPHGDSRRPQGAGQPPRQGPQAPVGLSREPLVCRSCQLRPPDSPSRARLAA